ncbi:MAG TPA: type II toxin-antitoxin system VapC family toxin [Actinopolymorphaceae bacterium]|jgi:hypothetical protein
MPFLVDTNVISELNKPAPDPNVLAWFEPIPGDDLYLSVLVIGEIRQGIHRLRQRDEHRAARLELWLETIRQTYADRILPVTAAVAEEWGRLNTPDPIATVDGLMAATALVHDLTFATRNTKHIERTGVRLVNPFEPA